MTYREEYRDLFSMPHDFALIHCISSDFKMGAGIARKFAEMGVKKQLIQEYSQQECWWGRGYVRMTWPDENCPYRVYNLITKQFYYQKPTLETFKEAVYAAGKCCCMANRFKVAMPMIGCGLDKLDWKDVKPIIQSAFSADQFEVVVCRLPHK